MITQARLKAIKELYPDFHCIEENGSVFIDGVEVETDKSKIDALEQEKAKEISQTHVRKKRGRLLTESDWVTIRATDTGTPVPTEWQTYRQALRDITEQTGFPENIDWPEKPES